MENNPDNEQEKTGEKKPATFFQKLLERAKQSKVTVMAIIVAAIVVLFSVVIATVSFTKVPAPKPVSDKNILNPASQQISFEELSREIRLVLFDNNVGAEAVSLTYDIDAGKSTHRMKITVPATALVPIHNGIVSLMNQEGIAVSRAQNGMSIWGDAVTYRVDIELEVYTEPEKIPPATGTSTPAVKPPVQTGKNKFGLTPPPKGNARIALLIDDAGMSISLAERLGKIKAPVTYAILPHMPYSKETAEIARKNGKGVFLHFPMEPENYPATDPGPGAVLLNMPDALIQSVTKSNVESIGRIDGANNHMGSALTADDVKIRQTLESLRAYTDTFVDSNTSNKSVALKVCQELDLKCGLNKKFIDNENDHAYIASKMYEAVDLAGKTGGIIIIGHLRPDTITVLEGVVPELQALGYQFVPINEFID